MNINVTNEVEPGQCPSCGGNDLEIGPPTIDPPNITVYPYECNDCGAQGEETYEMKLVQNILTKKGKEIHD